MNWLIKKVDKLVNFFKVKVSSSKKDCLTEKNHNDDKSSFEKIGECKNIGKVIIIII